MAVLLIDPALLVPPVQVVIPGPDLTLEAQPYPLPDRPIGQQLLFAIKASLCYSVVVEYVGHRSEAPVPLGIMVVCPGLKYAQALFYRPNLPLPPRSRRWKRVDAFIHNLTQNPPDTLERLEAEIRCQHTLVPARSRVFRFQEVQARIGSPWKLLTTLYREVLMKSVDVLDEVNEAVSSLHRMIEKHLDRMDREDCLFWLQQVNKELPPTRQELVTKLLCRYGILLSQGRPELASEIKEFFGIAQDILSI
jgi:hypothetical protein